MRWKPLAWLAVLVLAGPVGCPARDAGTAHPVGARAHAWAEPLEATGLENLHRVSPDLLRGAQPDREGFETLEGMGIRTVVNLRSGHSDAELTSGLGMDLVEIPIEPYDFGDADVARFLEIVTDHERTPVFVHCLHGSDRTGLMCAAYRVAVQGWSRDEAVAEMVSGGFGYHEVWTMPVEYIRNLEAERVLPGGRTTE